MYLITAQVGQRLEIFSRSTIAAEMESEAETLGSIL